MKNDFTHFSVSAPHGAPLSPQPDHLPEQYHKQDEKALQLQCIQISSHCERSISQYLVRAVRSIFSTLCNTRKIEERRSKARAKYPGQNILREEVEGQYFPTLTEELRRTFMQKVLAAHCVPEQYLEHAYVAAIGIISSK